MILAVDVHYTSNNGFAAGITFEPSNSEKSIDTFYTTTTEVHEYIPGEFYKRELPCILNLLKANDIQPSIIIIDGYVYTDGKSSPGLGCFLFDALDRKIPIIGVAKTAFSGIVSDYLLNRGKSMRPLYVTSIGIDLQEAKGLILNMHGKNRIPTLLKYVDRLCRDYSNNS